MVALHSKFSKLCLIETAQTIRVCLILLVCLSASAPVEASNYTQLRQTFVDAEKYLDSKNFKAWKRVQPALKNYPLYPYLKFKQLRARGSRSSNKTIAATIDNSVIPVPPRFLQWWLNRLYREKNWKLIAKYYSKPNSTSTRCRYAEALVRTGKTENAITEIEKLWLVGKSQHADCDKVFAIALRKGLIDEKLVWKRMLLTAARRNRSMTNYLAGLLKSSEARQWAAQLQQVQKNPSLVLEKNSASWSKSEFGQDLIELGFRRILRRNLDATVALWQKLEARGAISADNLHSIYRRIGVSLARAHRLEAFPWLRNVPASQHTDLSRAWLVRSAVLAENWKGVLDTIRKFPEAEKSKSAWKFWQARAFYETGDSNSALILWSELAKTSNYYGLLAADYLNTDYALPRFHTNLSNDTIKSVRDNPVVTRIRELLYLDRPYVARREYAAMSKDLDNNFWVSAAVLFHQWGYYDGAIRAMFNFTSEPHTEFVLQYPTPYKSLVRRESKRNNISEFWIYGIMRQESLFIRDIRSRAGAIGLMQLLPSTARIEARQLKLKTPRRSDLHDPSLNIRLGSSYFRKLLKITDGNLIFSLVSYNAGPNRMRKWRETSHKTDATIWVENIPFTETSGYVRKVLKNFIIYEHLQELNHRRISSYLVLPDN